MAVFNVTPNPIYGIHNSVSLKYHGSYRMESHGKKYHFQGIPGKSGKVRDFFHVPFNFPNVRFKLITFHFMIYQGLKS